LDRASYHPASGAHEGRYCRGNGYAVTVVGRSAVGLCRKFRRLSDQEAAIILLHEALHFAGQTEYPADPAAPDALTITKRVETSCRLYR